MITTFFLFIFLSVQLSLAQTMIQIRNNCPFTVWAAAIPGGGARLDYGTTWTYIPDGRPDDRRNPRPNRIWGRTNCNFDSSGEGKCQTGDCNGFLDCKGYGTPPNTLAEYKLNSLNSVSFFDISLVDGFNLPMEFGPASTADGDGCSAEIRCTADITGQCPTALRTPGGCHNPCIVFQTTEYCCTSGNCGPTNYSRFFKDRCPTSYSYPQDDAASTFTCPSGTNYRVVFCP